MSATDCDACLFCVVYLPSHCSSPLSLSFFRHHRHLHSFPTRRSSDLVERFEYGVDADAVAVEHPVGKIHRTAIDEDQLHLGMRHAERFDRILDGGRAGASRLELALVVLGGEEVVELLVEAKPGDGHGRRMRHSDHFSACEMEGAAASLRGTFVRYRWTV